MTLLHLCLYIFFNSNYFNKLLWLGRKIFYSDWCSGVKHTGWKGGEAARGSCVRWLLKVWEDHMEVSGTGACWQSILELEKFGCAIELLASVGIVPMVSESKDPLTETRECWNWGFSGYNRLRFSVDGDSGTFDVPIVVVWVTVVLYLGKASTLIIAGWDNDLELWLCVSLIFIPEYRSQIGSLINCHIWFYISILINHIIYISTTQRYQNYTEKLPTATPNNINECNQPSVQQLLSKTW